MKCKNCGNEMRLDDVDVISKSNRDKYYLCDVCDTSVIVEIRHGESLNEIWNLDED